MEPCLRALRSLLQHVFYPSVCRLCGNPLLDFNERVVCSHCFEKIEPLDEDLCVVCGKQFPGENDTCGECIVLPPPFKKHQSYAIYHAELRSIILLYKYQGIIPLKNRLSDFYQAVLSSWNQTFDWIVPVPADRKHRKKINHMLLLAIELSKRTTIPVLKNNLIKVRSTLPQAQLPRNERLQNLKKAFAVSNPALIKGKRILLLDDVYTTGTTVKTVSRVLTDCQAEVFAITLACS
jgi:ComF family protein